MATKKMKLPAGARVYDAANYLKTELEMAAYLDVTVSESGGDPAAVMNALETIARAQKRNMTELAKKAGITRGGLYDAFSERGNPSLGTTLKIVAALGLRLGASVP